MDLSNINLFTLNTIEKFSTTKNTPHHDKHLPNMSIIMTTNNIQFLWRSWHDRKVRSLFPVLCTRFTIRNSSNLGETAITSTWIYLMKLNLPVPTNIDAASLHGFAFTPSLCTSLIFNEQTCSLSHHTLDPSWKN